MIGEERIVKTSHGTIAYRYVKKQVKNINMRIDKSGQIIVSAGVLAPLGDVDRFVASKAEWINRKLGEVNKRNALFQLKSDEVLLFGSALKIKMIDANASVGYDDCFLYVPRSARCSEKTALSNALNALAKDIFEDVSELTYKCMRKSYQIEKPFLQIRMMKTRWGSCNPSACRITLNRNLIHYPLDFIEYVILHEYAHLIVPNHSSDFYKVIASFMPDYKERIKLVK